MATTTTIQSPAGNRTLAAFRYYNFRLYFFGQLVSTSGTWMQTVAQGWLVFSLTQSEIWLGIVACMAGLPALFLSPFAGVIVERSPRHHILIFTQVIQMMLAFILAWLTFTNTVQVWHIVALSFLLGTTNAIDAPARQALVVDMVGRQDLSSGISLTSVMYNASRVFGPSAAGIALVQFGPAWCFLLNGLSFLAVIVSLLAMHIEHETRIAGNAAPLTQLKEGLSFARHHLTIAPLLLLATVGAIFGFNVWTLLPSYADKVLNSPKEGYAALSTANGIGAVVAAILITSVGARFGRGRVVTVMAIVAAIGTFALSRMTTVPLALVFTIMAGFSLIMQFVTMNTLIQSEVPDEFRGRVLSLYTLTFFGVAPFGALALGFIAEAIGTPNALTLCAILSGSLSAIILARSPKLRQLA